MASRLSEESLKAMLDAGQQGLAITPSIGLELLRQPLIDFDQLLLSEDPEAAVQALPPQQLPLIRIVMHREITSPHGEGLLVLDMVSGVVAVVVV